MSSPGRAAGPRRAAVLGRPIGHSLSPVLHRAAYAELELDWTFEAVECDEAGLPDVLAGLDANWAGLALTMPLKAAVLPLLDAVSPLAQLVGAANTVVRRDGGWAGENTDVPGLGEVLADAGVGRLPEAAVLGGGATARSALAALAEVTRRVRVALRSPERAQPLAALAAALGVELEVLPWERAAEVCTAPLVVSTVPAGAGDALPGGSGLLVDVVYAPWPTPLAARWDGEVVGGLAMLVHQAALQVELMTGAAPPLDAMRAAGEQALVARAGSSTPGDPPKGG